VSSLVCELRQGHDNWLHPGAKSALSLQQVCIVHEEDKNVSVGGENGREGLAFHVGREYDPNLGSSVLLGTLPVWLANR
jgi:hypothetical protein